MNIQARETPMMTAVLRELWFRVIANANTLTGCPAPDYDRTQPHVSPLLLSLLHVLPLSTRERGRPSV
jgi:hypothetical protein